MWRNDLMTLYFILLHFAIGMWFFFILNGKMRKKCVTVFIIIFLFTNELMEINMRLLIYKPMFISTDSNMIDEYVDQFSFLWIKLKCAILLQRRKIDVKFHSKNEIDLKVIYNQVFNTYWEKFIHSTPIKVQSFDHPGFLSTRTNRCQLGILAFPTEYFRPNFASSKSLMSLIYSLHMFQRTTKKWQLLTLIC